MGCAHNPKETIEARMMDLKISRIQIRVQKEEALRQYAKVTGDNILRDPIPDYISILNEESKKESTDSSKDASIPQKKIKKKTTHYTNFSSKNEAQTLRFNLNGTKGKKYKSQSPEKRRTPLKYRNYSLKNKKKDDGGDYHYHNNNDYYYDESYDNDYYQDKGYYQNEKQSKVAFRGKQTSRFESQDNNHSQYVKSNDYADDDYYYGDDNRDYQEKNDRKDNKNIRYRNHYDSNKRNNYAIASSAFYNQKNQSQYSKSIYMGNSGQYYNN